MAVQVPTPAQVKEVAAEMGLSLTDADVESYIGLLRPNVAAYNVVDAMPDNLPPVKYPRTPGYRPGPEENKHNAWYVKTTVNGAARGRLKGKTVVLKDNIMLAGVPMMNGAATLEGYVPDIDATVVQRILDAGGTILGKAHCEFYCLSGGSHTNATGPVHNPHKMGYSAGGSSSGSAVLVALGEADMALGGDQGGSIRMPSSFCGTYGMKPTHGLVPYTGIMPIEIYVDHTGPMTANVADNALLLEVIAGTDGYDPRQYNVKTHPYTKMLEGGVKGMKIGVVKEGFEQANAEADVNDKVKAAAKKLEALGATVSEVSIPWHLLAPAIWMPIGIEGLTQTMMYGDGYGVSRPDLYVTSLMDFQRNWRNRANELSETTKLFTLFGTYVRKYYGSRYYGKAMNICRRLTAAYDAALSEHDLLLMPTTPIKATPLPPADAPRELYVERALNMISNTAPFDITHHPAMAVPCGMSDGLPVSVMLVGKHFDEPTIYKAAFAFEQAGDWKKM
ncbi:amidase [Vineibacter terrae]|uniref:Indoleacetamide hydrolase n=1 Tax=Vineibacter terrae TaxID=2586908 RepID=A0A5C8PH98_9HYPH|nr:amidase [Vineibacter terrae]TXL73176.1 amidase [Vineibacter terrae]